MPSDVFSLCNDLPVGYIFRMAWPITILLAIYITIKQGQDNILKGFLDFIRSEMKTDSAKV